MGPALERLTWGRATALSSPQTRPQGAFRVAEILVKQSAYEVDDPHALTWSVVSFVNTMINEGGCTEADLPPHAILSYYVDHYAAQVSNGGLSQYVGNTNWQPGYVENCFAGLRAMKLKAQFRVLRRLERLLDKHPGRVHEIAAANGIGVIDPAVEKLDDALNAAGGGEAIVAGNARWLKTLADVKPVPDGDYRDAMEALMASNPKRVERLAARNRQNLTETLASPLQASPRMLCWAKWKVPVRELSAGALDSTAPDGRKAIAWRVNSAQGCHHLYMLDDMVFLTNLYRGDGRRLTLDMEKEQRTQGNGLDDAQTPDPDKEEEVARLSLDVVHEAIEATRDKPVAQAAFLLCEALNRREDLLDISPVPEAAPDFDTWAVVTSKGVRLLEFSGDGARLTNRKGKELSAVTQSQIDDLVKADETSLV